MLLALMNYVLSNEAAARLSNRTSVTINEYYKIKDSIDTLFVGPSVFYYGVNPYYYDTLTGENSFVLATQSQRLDLSYQLIKDALRNSNIKKIILDTYTLSFDGVTPHNSLMAVYYNLPLSKIKLDLSNQNDSISLMDMFLPIIDTHNYLYEEKIPSYNMAYYKGYWGRGKVYDGDVKVNQDNYFAVKTISDKAINELKDLIQMCADRNVELFFTTAPFINYSNSGNSAKTISEINNYVESILGIKVHNYNYIASDMGLKATDFSDLQHLNMSGSKKFTIKLAEDLGGDKDRLQKYVDFELRNIKSRGKLKKLVVDEIYGKGYEIIKSSTNQDASDLAMYKILINDTPETIAGRISISIVVYSKEKMNENELLKFVNFSKEDMIFEKHCEKLGDGYCKVTFEMDADLLKGKNYLYLSNSISGENRIRVFISGIERIA